MKKEIVYFPEKENNADIETKTYSWCVKQKTFNVHIWLYSTLESLHLAYAETIRAKKSIGIFNSCHKNSNDIGVIKLAKDHLTSETIIHESMHAGIELQKHLHRHLSTRFEEAIVEASSSLADKLLNDYKHFIIA